jgi:hypothetical protein
MKVTADEHIHDSKSVPELVENIIKSDEMTTTTIGKLFGDDGLYESNDVFRYLSTDNGILHYIKVRKNAKVLLKRTYSKKPISHISEKGFAKVERG